MTDLKLYIAVLDEFPDHMVPTLVAHTVLAAHIKFMDKILCSEIFDNSFGEYANYKIWLEKSFKKVVLRVNQKEFDKIAALPRVFLGHENKTLDGRKSCVVVSPMHPNEIPNVLSFAKMWKPKDVQKYGE